MIATYPEDHVTRGRLGRAPRDLAIHAAPGLAALGPAYQLHHNLNRHRRGANTPLRSVT